MDVHEVCRLPTEDELEADDLQVKQAARRQRRLAKDKMELLTGMHSFCKSENPATRKSALIALSSLLRQQVQYVES